MFSASSEAPICTVASANVSFEYDCVLDNCDLGGLTGGLLGCPIGGLMNSLSCDGLEGDGAPLATSSLRCYVGSMLIMVTCVSSRVSRCNDVLGLPVAGANFMEGFYEGGAVCLPSSRGEGMNCCGLVRDVGVGSGTSFRLLRHTFRNNFARYGTGCGNMIMGSMADCSFADDCPCIVLDSGCPVDDTAVIGVADGSRFCGVMGSGGFYDIFSLQVGGVCAELGCSGCVSASGYFTDTGIISGGKELMYTSCVYAAIAGVSFSVVSGYCA